MVLVHYTFVGTLSKTTCLHVLVLGACPGLGEALGLFMDFLCRRRGEYKSFLEVSMEENFVMKPWSCPRFLGDFAGFHSRITWHKVQGCASWDSLETSQDSWTIV